MILTASVVGGWNKLELWDHTHSLLVALLFMVCALEVVLWKMTNSLFSRSSHFLEQDADYTGSDEYDDDDDIYYENLNSNYDQIARRQERYRQRQQQEEEQLIMRLSSNHRPANSIYNGHHSAASVFRYFQ